MVILNWIEVAKEATSVLVVDSEIFCRVNGIKYKKIGDYAYEVKE